MLCTVVPSQLSTSPQQYNKIAPSSITTKPVAGRLEMSCLVHVFLLNTHCVTTSDPLQHRGEHSPACPSVPVHPRAMHSPRSQTVRAPPPLSSPSDPTTDLKTFTVQLRLGTDESPSWPRVTWTKGDSLLGSFFGIAPCLRREDLLTRSLLADARAEGWRFCLVAPLAPSATQLQTVC